MRKIKDNAVSPVVGVMLMIVVTVIVAAVVAMFANGMTVSSESTPVAAISYLGSVQGNNFEDGYAGEIGLVFQHEGGDKIVFDDLTFTLIENVLGVADESTVAFYDAPDLNSTVEPGKAKISAKGLTYRFKKVGVTVANGKQSKNQFIVSGDRFLVYIDEVIQNEGSRYNTAHVVVKRDNLVYSEGWFKIGPSTTYSFKDTKTGNVIASGTLAGDIYEVI